MSADPPKSTSEKILNHFKNIHQRNMNSELNMNFKKVTGKHATLWLKEKFLNFQIFMLDGAPLTASHKFVRISFAWNVAVSTNGDD